MKIDKYECSFPGKLWVTVLDYNEPLNKLINKFTFKKNIKGFDESVKDIELLLSEDKNKAYAACYPVMENSTGEMGVLTIIFDEIDVNVISHEAVHVADYFFEVGGIYGEDFSEGNEAYAYLVGWSAGNISKTVIDYERRRDKKQQERI